MSTEYRVVPVEPTREMREAGKKVGEYPYQLHALRNPQLVYAAMLSAAPVPPAGGEPKTLRYMFRFAGCVTTSGPESWRTEVDEEKPAQFLFDDGRVTDFIELVDRAHVTQLQAEVAHLRAGMHVDYDLDAWLEWSSERDALKAELRAARQHEYDAQVQNSALQSELTKARELLGKLERAGLRTKAHGIEVRDFLSLQSAPAVKDGE